MLIIHHTSPSVSCHYRNYNVLEQAYQTLQLELMSEML